MNSSGAIRGKHLLKGVYGKDADEPISPYEQSLINHYNGNDQKLEQR